jgi:hypothetical protein
VDDFPTVCPANTAIERPLLVDKRHQRLGQS